MMKTVRPRRVFGRVRFSVRSADGTEAKYIVEMGRDGLRLRRKHHRQVTHLTFTQLTDLVARQLLLPL
jgi:hypothetical protein